MLIYVNLFEIMIFLNFKRINLEFTKKDIENLYFLRI